MHFCFGRMRHLSSITALNSPFSLFYGRKGSLGRLRPSRKFCKFESSKRLRKDVRRFSLPGTRETTVSPYPTHGQIQW